MTKLEWYALIIVSIGPTVFILLLTTLSIKLLEVIYKIMETKFETAVKRVISLTIIDKDVDNIEAILKHFTQEKTHEDRRLIGFAERFLGQIEIQRHQVKLLEIADQREAAEKFFKDLDKDNELTDSEEILELIDAVPEKGFSMVEGEKSAAD